MARGDASRLDVVGAVAAALLLAVGCGGESASTPGIVDASLGEGGALAVARESGSTFAIPEAGTVETPEAAADPPLDAGVYIPPVCQLEAGALDAGRVPTNHRPSPSTCPSERGPGSIGDASATVCDADIQCSTGINGRCEGPVCGPDSCLQTATECSYDACLTDSDCGDATPCICRPSATSPYANTCERGSGCAVDSQCGPANYCSPTGIYADGVPEWCGVQYQCHTQCDTCLDDSDCSPGVGCNFVAMLGYWTCATGCGPPPP